MNFDINRFTALISYHMQRNMSVGTVPVAKLCSIELFSMFKVPQLVRISLEFPYHS